MISKGLELFHIVTVHVSLKHIEVTLSQFILGPGMLRWVFTCIIHTTLIIPVGPKVLQNNKSNCASFHIWYWSSGPTATGYITYLQVR